ncbi:MAG: Lytic transglycosylase, catalytic [Ramlibacter sp.]|nr:Lytic transglycosylase, catalytic [Ramlibacter sp.]
MLAIVFAGRAAADVYSFTDSDGSVSLSNVPADARYSVLLSDEGRPAATSPLPPRVAPALLVRAGYDAIIERVARVHGLESALLRAVISVESRYNANAVSPKGAVGLMQLMPATARRYGVLDAFDPQQNVDGGARYLRDLLRLFGDDVHLALAAYNAGEGAVVKYGNRIPPFGETQRYVPQVLEFYQRYRGAS